MQPSNIQGQSHNLEVLNEAMREMSLRDKDDDCDSLNKQLSSMQLEDAPDKSDINNLFRMIEVGNIQDKMHALSLANHLVQNNRVKITQISPAFIASLYGLFTSGDSREVQLMVLELMTNLSTKERQVTDVMFSVPIVDRLFQVIYSEGRQSTRITAMRCAGNLLLHRDHAIKNLFEVNDNLLEIIKYSWTNKQLFDYTTWLLCNIWSFRVQHYEKFVAFVETRGYFLVKTIIYAFKIFQKELHKNTLLWGCLATLRQFSRYTIQVRKEIVQQKLSASIVTVLTVPTTCSKLEEECLSFIDEFSTVDVFTQQLFHHRFIEVGCQAIITRSEDRKLHDKLISIIHKLLKTDITQSRRLLQCGLLNTLQKLMRARKVQNQSFLELVMIVCMPTYIMNDSEIVRLFREFNIEQILTNYLMRDCNPYTEQDKQIDLEILQVIERYIAAAEETRNCRIQLNNIATSLYLIVNRGASSKLEQHVNQRAFAMLQKLQHSM